MLSALARYARPETRNWIVTGQHRIGFAATASTTFIELKESKPTFVPEKCFKAISTSF